MHHALDSCQIYHKNQGLNKGLSEFQYKALLEKPLFREIDSHYQGRGLSEWGGLAWFTAVLLQAQLKKNQPMPPLTASERLLIIKITYISQILSEQVDTLLLSKDDKEMIEKAIDYAMQYEYECAIRH